MVFKLQLFYFPQLEHNKIPYNKIHIIFKIEV